MLPQEGVEEEKEFMIPPRIKCNYQNFNLLTETSSYKVFEAEARDSKAKHVIRVLDHSKELVKAKSSFTATLFVQELLHLQSRYPNSVLTNTFEISEDGQHIACATLKYLPLSCHFAESQEVLNPKDHKLLEKMINDTLLDIEFLRENLQMKKVMDVLGMESLCFLKQRHGFFLSNWAKCLEIAVPSDMSMSVQPHTSDDKAGEIKSLAFATLKVSKVNDTEIEALRAIANVPIFYNPGVKSLLEKYFKDSKELQNLLERMLILDLQNLPNLEELRIKDDDSKELSKQLQLLEKDKKLLEDKVQEQDQKIENLTEKMEEAKREQERMKSILLEEEQKRIAEENKTIKLNEETNKLKAELRTKSSELDEEKNKAVNLSKKLEEEEKRTANLSQELQTKSKKLEEKDQNEILLNCLRTAQIHLSQNKNQS